MFKKIPANKRRHFWVGVLLGILLMTIPKNFLQMPELMWFSLFFSAFISYGFEVFSLLTGKGRYDVADAVYSFIGALAGILLVLLFDKTFYTTTL